jgi:signal transduction histidine kinase/CheY-like chemotaxis protein
MSSSGPLAERNHQERAAYIRRPSRTVSGLKRDVEIQNLAAVTLLDALDCDDRPSFAIEVPACPTYNDPLELIYSNAALRAASLLAKVSGQDATSVFIEGSAPQLAFRNWVYGHVDKIDLQRRGNAYTFEGHIWNAVTVGRSKIVTGVPTLLLWVDAAPGGRSNRALRDRKAPPNEHRVDTPPAEALPPAIRPSGNPTEGAEDSSRTQAPVAQNVSFDYTLDTLPPAIKPIAHIDYFRSVNWADTPLGPLESWSSDLRCMANMVLSNKCPAVLFWGSDVVMLYNEHYIQLLGSLHPCMGKSIRTEAPEHWLSFQPIVDHINATGESMAESDMLLFTERHGFLEETHWSFQFVPILDREGQVTAYYQSFYEVTDHRLLERRVSSLVAMGSQSADARDLQTYWDNTLRSLTLNDKDVPFALLYAAERDVSAELPPTSSSPGSIPSLERCILKGAIGVSANHPIAPAVINIDEDAYIFHPYLRQAARSGKATIVHLDDLTLHQTILQGIHWRGYGDPCRIVIVCPILPTTEDQVQGFLIIGVNPRRPFDEEYQQFVQVMVRLLATSLASVVLLEEEVRQRETAIVQAAQIQEQLMTEIQLKEKKFQRFAERSDVGIFITDAAGTYTYRNQRFYDLFDIASTNDNATQVWRKIAFEEDIPYCESIFGKLVMHHEPVSFELRTRMPWTPPSELSQPQAEDAEHFKWILCSAYAELGPNGELVEVVGNVVDISKNKWAEGLQKSRTDSALQGKQHLEHFIDTTSHEMRNPLSAILQCADEILSSCAQGDSQSPTPNGWSNFLESTMDAAQTIAQCAQHMRHIVDDILTISKLDSGLLVITPVVAQPEGVARNAVKMFNAEARAADIDLSLVVDQSYRDLNLDWASLDPTRVLQILINLLTNAIKFTRLESTKCITVSLAASIAEPTSISGGIQFNEDRLVSHDHHLEDDWKQAKETLFLQFSVTDTGRGLTEEERSLLFTRFSQASPRTHIHYGGKSWLYTHVRHMSTYVRLGSGLGLFISRRLTELQGGAIGLASESRKGSTFSFYIKTRRAIPTAARKDSLPHVFPEDMRHRQQAPFISLSRPPHFSRPPTSEGMRPSRTSNPPSSSFPHQPASVKPPPPEPHVRLEGLGLPEGPDPQEMKRTKSIPEILHVLVVEDNLVNQRVLAKQLRNLGCVVSVANHGQEALDFLPKTTCWNFSHPLSASLAKQETHHIPSTEPLPPSHNEDAVPIELSLVLMDWEMPIMDGLTAVAEIRRLETNGLLKGRIPVIGVTANVRQQQIDTAMQAGMDDVVGKPFRVAELLVRMRGVVQGLTQDAGTLQVGYDSFGEGTEGVMV